MASKRLVVVLFLLVCKTGQGDPTSAPAAEEEGAGDASFPISVGVLLPENTPVIEYPYALSRVVPGVRIALESHRFKELLPNVSIDFRALDSECSSTWTPLRAMELMVSPNARPVDLLLGPACDLAASPVARYNTQWKTNIVTAGCGAFAYRDKNATLLTRVPPQLRELRPGCRESPFPNVQLEGNRHEDGSSTGFLGQRKRMLFHQQWYRNILS